MNVENNPETGTLSIEDAVSLMADDSETTVDPVELEEPQEDGEDYAEDATDEQPETDSEDADVVEEPDEDEEDGEELVYQIWNPDEEAFVEVSEDEAKRSVMMQRSFTQKTQELAEERRNLEAEIDRRFNERYETERSQLKDLLVQWAVPDQSEPNWGQLLQSGQLTAEQVIMQQEVYRQRKAQSDRAKELYREIQAEENAKQQAEHEDQLKAARDDLMLEYPDWADPKKRQSDLQLIVNTAEAMGFSQQEVGDMVDPRQYKVLKKLGELMAIEGAAVETKKIVETSKKLKPGAKVGKRSKAAQRNRQAMARLGKTGSIEDALAIDFD